MEKESRESPRFLYARKAAKELLRQTREKVKELPAVGPLDHEIFLQFPPRDEDAAPFGFGHFFVSFKSHTYKGADLNKYAFEVGVYKYGYSRHGMLFYETAEKYKEMFETNDYSELLADCFIEDSDGLSSDENIQR